MTQLFISHSSRNNAEALALSQWLTQEGLDVPFLHFAAQQLSASGKDWMESLRDAINLWNKSLALINLDWVNSYWCQHKFIMAQ